MARGIDIQKFKNKAKLTDRYEKQLQRLQSAAIETTCIEKTVKETIVNLAATKTSPLVIYGEPQSGKTEMMISLTAKLLDDGHRIIVHLMNDSVDLLAQNLIRFKRSGLAPAPRSLSELLQTSDNETPQELVVFCKKNAKDLEKLIKRLNGKGALVVVDDEADYATPNSKVNEGAKTKINNLVAKLVGDKGLYIGVTATPARLDLNNTLRNDTAKWVKFLPHSNYTGQDVFFPLNMKIPYRLTLLEQGGNPEEAREAVLRFIVTVAYLNCYRNETEENYTMLVHTSGKTEQHEQDRVTIEQSVQSLINSESKDFDSLVTRVHQIAKGLYPDAEPDVLTEYAIANASRATLVVLNASVIGKPSAMQPPSLYHHSRS